MNPLSNYEERVYAGVLGKVCGVYAGRPIEGATCANLLANLGEVGHYVHETVGKPLVVSDDDISGTLTFVRALEDSGLYAQTPADFYGKTWLNYLIPGRSVIWWGNLGNSTEHTAFLRLQAGHPSPVSGSIALNGQVVAEQIGGQIFIDGFGLVAPGDPALAARFARHAAGVSHGGESVHAAVVVASMVAAAFVESDMERLLDIGVGQIPADCLIAAVHRDVRAWCREEKDWKKVFAQIKEQYGYRDYTGGCHIIPNHALMVMAWSLAGSDVFQAQRIINTAGWDTDCNAGNVGAVMGVQLGLEGINARYDYQSPFADRILCPSAEGTACTTDCLREAQRIARIGRKVMGWPEQAEPKNGALFHFSHKGARHGFMAEETDFAQRGNIDLEQVTDLGGALRCRFKVGVERPGRLSTPLLGRIAGRNANYELHGTPLLYPGQKLRLSGICSQTTGPVRLTCFVRGYQTKDSQTKDGLFQLQELHPTQVHRSPPKDLISGQAFTLEFVLPDNQGLPLFDLGLEITSETNTRGEILIDSVAVSGEPNTSVLPKAVMGDHPGWISTCDSHPGTYLDDPLVRFGLLKNQGSGFAVTGNRLWKNYQIQATVCPHLAQAWGLIVRYQGIERYLAVLADGHEVRLIRRWYQTETVLASIPWQSQQAVAMRIACDGPNISVTLDGKTVLQAQEDSLLEGGAGLMTVTGHIRFSDVEIRPL